MRIKSVVSRSGTELMLLEPATPVASAIDSRKQSLLRVVEEIKSYLCNTRGKERVTARTLVDDETCLATMVFPNWGDWQYDDSQDSLSLTDASREHVKELIDAMRARHLKHRFMWNDYLNEDQHGIVIYIETVYSSLSETVIDKPSERGKSEQEYSVEIQKSRYNAKSTIKLSTKTLVVKAVSLEAAMDQARRILQKESKYATKNLPNGDSVGWSLVVDTKTFAPKHATLVAR